MLLRPVSWRDKELWVIDNYLLEWRRVEGIGWRTLTRLLLLLLVLMRAISIFVKIIVMIALIQRPVLHGVVNSSSTKEGGRYLFVTLRDGWNERMVVEGRDSSVSEG